MERSSSGRRVPRAAGRAARIVAATLAACALIRCGLAAAQTPPAPDTFPSEVDLVHVDVVVTDKAGHPVTGLPAAAFRVVEDGEPQPLVSFEAVDIPNEAAAGGVAPAVVSTNTTGEGQPQRRNWVLVFDDIHLGAGSVELARETCLRFIAQHTQDGDRVVLLAPGQDLVWSATMPAGRGLLASVTGSLGARRALPSGLSASEALRIVEDGDRGMEDLALERYQSERVLPSEELVTGGYADPGRTEEDVRREQMEYVRSEARQTLEAARYGRRRVLDALASVLEGLAGSRGRTSVVLVSEGFFDDPDDHLSPNLVPLAQRARAAVHFLDVRGVGVGSGPDSFTRRAAPDRGLSAYRDESVGAEVLAEKTGGYAVQGNDLDAALDRLGREASHYYLLGYPPPGKRDGRYRRIRVEVDRPGVVVRVRAGYSYASKEGQPPDAAGTAVDLRLQEALGDPFPVEDIPLRMTARAWGPAEGGGVRVDVALEAAVEVMGLERQGDGSLGTTLDVVLVVNHTRPEASQAATLSGVSIQVPDQARLEGVWLPFQHTFALPPGPCQVKVVVHDRGSGALGTVSHSLDVPDAGATRVSALILSDVLDSGDEKIPRLVAHRDFPVGSILYCYFEVDPGATAPPLRPSGAVDSYAIVDGRGEVVQRAALPLATRSDNGGLGRLLEIPLARMQPGEYALVVDLGGGETSGGYRLREPFAVTPPRGFSDALYHGALEAYLAGDFQGAVTTLLQWPPAEVLAAARRIPEEDERLRTAALMLHTDLAMVLRKHGLHDGAETHLAIGRALLEDQAQPDLERDWLLSLALAHQARGRPAEALSFYEECARRHPEAGECRLGAGTLYERSAFPDGFARGNLSLPPGQAARKAEERYREALEAQPSLTEARLRLARVLQRTNRPDEALPQLIHVAQSGEDSALKGLAHLFWGEILEGRDDVDGAIEHYRAACDADGELQIAALALAQALYRRDGRSAAVEVLVPALTDTDRSSLWLAYRRGPRTLSSSPLGDLRQRVRTAMGAR